jgi:dGTPase
MEVSSIARTIGRALRLNEDLIEALALLHDIGHPPFGHAGEEALDEMLKDDGGFSHNRFALTLVEELEQRYPSCAGLNLTYEVLGGQRRRIDKSESTDVPLLEVQVVDLADSIAYNAHDVDDAVELGWLELDELLKLPILATCHQSVKQRFGHIEGAVLRRALVHELINLQVAHLIYESEQKLEQMESSSSEQVRKSGLRLGIYGPLATEKSGLQQFLYSRLYRHEVLVEARTAAQNKIKAMVQILLDDEDKLPETFRSRCRTHGTRIGIVDYIASMTDQSFLETYRQLEG